MFKDYETIFVFTAQLRGITQTLHTDGFDLNDHSVIVKYYEKVSETTIED